MIRYERLETIDDLTRRDHFFLDPADECYYLGEYTARKGWSYSAMNGAISNLKIPPTQTHRLQHKKKAILTFAGELRRIIGKAGCAGETFVPVPPSKAPDHPDFDLRLLLVLNRAFDGFEADIRPLVKQIGDREPAHLDTSRPRSPNNFNYEIDEALCGLSCPEAIVIFDDMITSGASFVAMKRVLKARFPKAAIRGLFLSRCIHEADFVPTTS